MRFADGSRTDVGRGRPENEDNLLVDREHGLYAVADGMGGHRAGEVASATAIETLQAAYLDGQRLDQAVAAANAAVFAKGADDDALRGMGTTLTAIAVEGDSTALLGHVGDSRAYLMRNGTVTQVTDDHSLVEQLVREGRLTPEQAQNHPQRAIITRALGVDSEVEVDTYRIDLKAGDRLLICSDGLTNMLSDDTIAQALRRHADPQQAADILVDMANQAGGDDNITVVILDALSTGRDVASAESAGAAAAVPPGRQDTGQWPVTPVGPDGGAEAGPDGGAEAGPDGGAEAGPDGGADAEPDEGADADGGPVGAGVETEPPPEPDADDEPVGAGGGVRRGRGLRSLLLWGLPILAVIGIAVGAVGWYARRTYYVGLSADRVTLFKGVPGGLLGWEPTIDHRTDLTATDLTPADRADLESGHRFASKSDADRFLERLRQAHEAMAASSTTTTAPGAPGEPGAAGAAGGPGEPAPAAGGNPPPATETTR